MVKNFLPLKTKIAIRLQDVISIILLFPIGFLFYAYFQGLSTAAPPGQVIFLLLGIVGLLIFAILIISGYLMLKRKKIGWWIAIIINSLCLAILLFLSRFIVVFVLVFFAGTLTICILLLLDRKNFFKIAS